MFISFFLTLNINFHRIFYRLINEKECFMKVFVDENEIDVFSGAVIADILRSYSQAEYDEVSNGRKKLL